MTSLSNRFFTSAYFYNGQYNLLDMPMNDFQNEWVILHADIEKYERFSLFIKLFSVLVSVLCIAYFITAWVGLVVILILWLQDGIWKTFQKRMETRIIFIEKTLNEIKDSLSEANDNPIAFQYYTQWQNQRQGGMGLIKEYLTNSVKPTVAYPYAILITLILLYYQSAG